MKFPQAIFFRKAEQWFVRSMTCMRQIARQKLKSPTNMFSSVPKTLQFCAAILKTRTRCDSRCQGAVTTGGVTQGPPGCLKTKPDENKRSQTQTYAHFQALGAVTQTPTNAQKKLHQVPLSPRSLPTNSPKYSPSKQAAK